MSTELAPALKILMAYPKAPRLELPTSTPRRMLKGKWFKRLSL